MARCQCNDGRRRWRPVGAPQRQHQSPQQRNKSFIATSSRGRFSSLSMKPYTRAILGRLPSPFCPSSPLAPLTRCSVAPPRYLRAGRQGESAYPAPAGHQGIQSLHMGPSPVWSSTPRPAGIQLGAGGWQPARRDSSLSHVQGHLR